MEDYYLEVGTAFLGITDQETIDSIKVANTANQQWRDEEHKRKTRYTVPRGLTKKEYTQMKKDLQPIIDDIKNKINKAKEVEKIILEIEQAKYIRKKEFLNKLLRPVDKEANVNIERAKQYPITELIEFKHNTTRCPFHQEKTPSMHYYPKNNKAHCFGACSKSFDSINIYQLLNNVDFATAVKALQSF